MAWESNSELQGFRVWLTAKGRDAYAAHSGKHDDLVIAVALAVWFCELPDWWPPASS